MIKQGADLISECGPDALKLKLTGEIDHHNASSIRSKMDDEIFLYRSKRVELDLSEVDFMDSSGLGLILGRKNTAADAGGVLVLKNPSRRVEKVLSLAGLERMIKIERKRENEK